MKKQILLVIIGIIIGVGGYFLFFAQDSNDDVNVDPDVNDVHPARVGKAVEAVELKILGV